MQEGSLSCGRKGLMLSGQHTLAFFDKCVSTVEGVKTNVGNSFKPGLSFLFPNSTIETALALQ